jgi:hypothetical protein
MDEKTKQEKASFWASYNRCNWDITHDLVGWSEFAVFVALDVGVWTHFSGIRIVFLYQESPRLQNLASSRDHYQPERR